MADSFLFYNLSEDQMTFFDVIERLKTFIRQDPRASYLLSVGTDSQIHNHATKFITAVHLHRKGKGAWGCLKHTVVNRPINSLREKISLETAYSQEIAGYLLHDYLTEITDLLLPFTDEGADLTLEVHLDIGKKGLTKDLIQEMTGRITSMGISAKIKPDSYAASSYANRYTK
ncbi:ribonuclease H-like YkuK family protein [Bacillus sp. CLL-7-23]|uniref:Ribonuclease H-like YkuK family protein n=1 Tax=Bacillus changyiensis TaxID=3004103 RepID=A0ABT4X3E7_9BACI|nr:ribonuclease H-like YkuK family protein [Bacillus changyiensis]MDA7026264.1 ribonuclease H-like YkuK family protein [Bacillus changyiensis]